VSSCYNTYPIRATRHEAVYTVPVPIKAVGNSLKASSVYIHKRCFSEESNAAILMLVSNGEEDKKKSFFADTLFWQAQYTFATFCFVTIAL